MSMKTDTAGVAIDRGALRRWRQLLGETQASLAKKAQLSSGYLCHIETGRRPTISPPAFVRICNALGLAESERELMVLKDVTAA